MKMGESSGVTVTEKMAKLIVKKYGKKDHLNVDDCLKINTRRYSKSTSKSPGKDKKWEDIYKFIYIFILTVKYI